MRPAEGVDALRIVADHQHVPVRRRGGVDDLALQSVGVLVLVDQHRGKAPTDALARGRYLDEQPLPVQEQVVEIHRVHLRLALGEASGDAQDLLFQRDELRRLRRDHFRQRPLRVHGGRVQIDQRVGPGKPALSDAVPEVGGGARHHLLRVLAIEQPEAIGVSEPRGVLAQEPMRDVVERAAPHPARLHPAELADARHHLPRRLVGERQQQDLLRRRSGLEQVRHAIRQRPRLARAGAGDHQRGTRIAERHRALLVGEIPVVIDQAFARRRGCLQGVPAHRRLHRPLLGESGLVGHRRSA